MLKKRELVAGEETSPRSMGDTDEFVIGKVLRRQSEFHKQFSRPGGIKLQFSVLEFERHQEILFKGLAHKQEKFLDGFAQAQAAMQTPAGQELRKSHANQL